MLAVSSKFDEHDIPMDIMWLDIEHTDGKKYFTWDARKFPDSLGMVQVRDQISLLKSRAGEDQGYLMYRRLHT